ncbi:hypothetical protein SADUNF_Sadunf08G0050500 [Salix dunnii]|uniref:Uncharacterized protein n=1 Tax=Salix dunnii TaxID=1413687 RepID=A0A835JSV3_9ROSI|nr:hypothetical protein SADUNF_Sadunf08G0050500 [Salix dunnii]
MAVVRLNKLGDEGPYNPNIAYSTDLSKMWGDNESFNRKSSRTCSVNSWRFMLREERNWMRSLPINPHRYVESVD